MSSTPPAEAPRGTLVTIPADAADRTALTARLAALGEVSHPHLVPILEVRHDSHGAYDVVHARGEAADLPAVLAVRGHLSAGEAATVGRNIAQALAALHAAGLVHGPLDPVDVVVRPGGAPALRPRAVTPPLEWTAAEDVRATARLVEAVLGTRPVVGELPAGLVGDPVVDPHGALREALTPALGADPGGRPEGGTLAAIIDAACEPTPLRLPDPATLAGAALAGMLRESAPPPTDRRRGHRRARGAGPVRPSHGGGRASQGDRPRKGRPQRTGRSVVPEKQPTEKPDGSRVARRSGRRRNEGSRGAPLLRPVLVVAGIGLAIGMMTGAALELRDGGQGETRPTSSTATPTASTPASAHDAVSDREDPGGAAVALTQRRLDVLAALPMPTGDDPAADTVTDDATVDPATGQGIDRGPGVGPEAVDGLAAVDVVGSPAHAADAALLAELRAGQTRPLAPRVSVHETEVLTSSADAARVRLRYLIGEHEQVAHDGTRTQVRASEPRTATLDLVWTEAGWRVTTVS